VPVAVVRGDQLDQNALSVEEAYVGDVSALARLNERYRVPTVIVAIVEGDKAGPLTVGGVRYDMQTGAKSELPQITVPDASQLGDAARKIHAKLDEEWRGLATVRRDTQAALDVVVPIRRSPTGCRCASGWAPSPRSSWCRSGPSNPIAPSCTSITSAPPSSSRDAGAGRAAARQDADKWRLLVR
jgi:hypothetical protein